MGNNTGLDGLLVSNRERTNSNKQYICKGNNTGLVGLLVSNSLSMEVCKVFIAGGINNTGGVTVE